MMADEAAGLFLIARPGTAVVIWEKTMESQSGKGGPYVEDMSADKTGNKEYPMELVSRADNRLIVSCHSAKRSTVAPGRIARRFAQQFGPVELSADKKWVDQNSQG
jgi:hypothetical protein